MTMLWQDGFNHYGELFNGVTNMLAGPWAELTSSNTDVQGQQPACPIVTEAMDFDTPFAAGTQDHSFRIRPKTGTLNIARRVLPAGATSLIAAFRVYMPDLPNAGNDQARIMVFADSGNKALFFVSLGTTGTVGLYAADGNTPGVPGTLLLATAGPVFKAGTWTHFEMKIVINAATGSFELRVDEQLALLGTGMNTGSTAIAQIRLENGTTGFSMFWNDMTMKNLSGTLNNDFEGDIRVVTLFPNGDTAVAGWTPFPRQRFGTGILDTTTSRACALRASNSSQLDLGSADFTLEGQIRFLQFPTTTNKAAIMGKWTESTNQREWQVYLGGPSLESGNFVFRRSTNGQSGTVAEIISYPVAFELNTWYHWAIVRNAGEVLLYINGVQQGMPVADSSTYFAASAFWMLGCQDQDSAGNVVDGTGFNGFMDEVRVTPGVARYTTEFAPPTGPFPRNVGGDPNFGNVAFLAGFDNDLQDESSFGRLMTQEWIELAAPARPQQLTPQDAPQAYKTIYEHTPIDDNFIQASFLPATGIFTLTARPSNNETVALGAKTYTFKTTLTGAANEVLIGADNLSALFNIYSAVNKLSGEGTLYGTGTVANTSAQFIQLPGDQLEAIASTLGTAGNSVATTETCVDGSWSHATLTGGANIPGPSAFTVDHPPNDTTQLKALTIVHRTYKTDSGSCKVQTSLVGPGGGVINGTEVFIGVNPAYHEDVFEVDPDTALALTPTTIIGGKIKINRTE